MLLVLITHPYLLWIPQLLNRFFLVEATQRAYFASMLYPGIIHTTGYNNYSPQIWLEDLDDVLTMNTTGQSYYQYFGTSIASGQIQKGLFLSLSKSICWPVVSALTRFSRSLNVTYLTITKILALGFTQFFSFIWYYTRSATFVTN